MSFFVTAASIGGGSAILGSVIIGAGVGGAYSAVTGDGDILNSMLTGGLIGLGVGGIGTAAGLTGAATTAGGAGATGAGTVASQAAAPLSTAVSTPIAAGTVAPAGAGLGSGLAAGTVAAPGAAPLALTSGAAPLASGAATVTGAGAGAGGGAGLTGSQMLGYGLAGTTAMQLLGNKQKTGVANQADPGQIRPYNYSSTPNKSTGDDPSSYVTASYDASGNPIMDTRERNYFKQNFAAMQPYSAKTGTANPNIPLPTSSSVNAAMGGIMGNYDDEIGNDDVGLNQGNMQKGIFGLGYAHGGAARYADKGMVNEEAELRKTVMNNFKKLNPEQMQNVMGSFQNTKNFALGGIADMLDSQFAAAQNQENLMPNYSYNPTTQTYANNGIDQSAVNLPPLAADLVTSLTQQYQAANPYKYTYDANSQKYNSLVPNMGQLQTFKADQDRAAAETAARNAEASSGGDPSTNNAAAGGLMGYGSGGHLGDYSDGGRLLRGPGDGVSDSIPAMIANKQPARLADGEFVIPARIVSEIGNGSTDAGAKRLYDMMDRIQAGRKKTIGKKNVAKDTKAKKHLLA
jgi:hypothetical protein